MSKNVHVTDAIKLEGFQAILEPGKFGYSLAAIVGTSIIDALEVERQAVLKWAESKLKNPKRATLKPTPWEVAAEGLKTKLIRTVKQQAAGELQNTDWYITRKADAGTAVPSAITNHRAAVRTKCAEMETAITNAADTPALETLYTYTEQEDGSVTRPLGELPTLES